LQYSGLFLIIYFGNAHCHNDKQDRCVDINKIDRGLGALKNEIMEYQQIVSMGAAELTT